MRKLAAESIYRFSFNEVFGANSSTFSLLSSFPPLNRKAIFYVSIGIFSCCYLPKCSEREKMKLNPINYLPTRMARAISVHVVVGGVVLTCMFTKCYELKKPPADTDPSTHSSSSSLSLFSTHAESRRWLKQTFLSAFSSFSALFRAATIFLLLWFFLWRLFIGNFLFLFAIKTEKLIRVRRRQTFVLTLKEKFL